VFGDVASLAGLFINTSSCASRRTCSMSCFEGRIGNTACDQAQDRLRLTAGGRRFGYEAIGGGNRKKVAQVVVVQPLGGGPNPYLGLGNENPRPSQEMREMRDLTTPAARYNVICY